MGTVAALYLRFELGVRTNPSGPAVARHRSCEIL